MNVRSKAYFYMITSILPGAFLPIVLTLVTGMNIFEFFMLIYLFSLPMAYALAKLTKNDDKLIAYVKDKRMLAKIAIVGLLTYPSYQFTILYAEHFVSASLATAVLRTSPLLMLLFLPTILKERLSKSQIVALGLAFLGLYVALTSGTFQLQASVSDLPVLMLVALGAVGYALSSVLIKKYMFNMESAMFIFLCAAFVLFTALFFLTGAQFTPITPTMIIVMIWVSLANNIYGLYTYYVALRLFKTTLVTNLYFLSPFITFLFAYFLLGEAIQPYYLAIAGLVAVGILIQKLDKVGGTYLTRKGRKMHNSVIFDVTGAFSESGNVSIITSIDKGDRVLALKLAETCKDKLDDLVNGGGYSGVFTDAHKEVMREASFIRDVVGAADGEMVVMKVGDPGESEMFFEALFSRLQPNEVSPLG
jgi:drug/metabolite transporter (DMT)-like permease